MVDEAVQCPIGAVHVFVNQPRNEIGCKGDHKGLRREIVLKIFRSVLLWLIKRNVLSTLSRQILYEVKFKKVKGENLHLRWLQTCWVPSVGYARCLGKTKWFKTGTLMYVRGMLNKLKLIYNICLLIVRVNFRQKRPTRWSSRIFH